MPNLAQLSTNALKQLLALVESREALVITLAAVDAKIAKIAGDGQSVPAPVTKAKPGRKPSKGKRGAVAAQIVESLKSAGTKGIAVSDLAKTLGMKPANVSIWLGTTGKRSKLVEKIGRGVYRLAGPAAAPAPVPAAAPKSEMKAAKPGRKRSKLSAEGRARIIAAQKARWAKAKAATKAKK